MKNFMMMIVVAMTLGACAHKHTHGDACGKCGEKTECAMDKKSDGCACGSSCQHDKTEKKP